MKKVLFTILIIQTVAMNISHAHNLVDQEIVIPIDMSTHRPIVDVIIDGKGPYKFIFDTGSTTNIIDENLQELYHFKVVGEDPLRTPGSSNRLSSKRVTVPDVKFQGTNISKDIDMNVIGLRKMLPVDGIIGGFFFEDYLLTIDYPASKLTLEIGELNKNDPSVFSFVQDARTLNLNIDVAGHEVEAHLDSGNPLTMTIPYSMLDQLSFKGAPQKGLPMRTPVASFDTWEAQLSGSVTIGNAIIKDPKVRLAEGYDYVNIGYGVINTLKISIDRKNSLIKFDEVNTFKQQNRKLLNKNSGQDSPLAGTYEGDRRVWVNEAGKLVYQRTPAPIALELILVEGDLYELTVPDGVRAPQEIPKVHFIRNKKDKIIGLTLVYKNGREDGPYKKVSE